MTSSLTLLFVLLQSSLPPAASQPPYVERVARAYYAVPRAQDHERTGTLSGRVVDRRGRGIAGAEIELALWSRSKVVQRAITDPDGRFRVARARQRANVITVVADGFARYSLAGFAAAEGVTLALDREVDDQFLSSLSALADSEERLWGVLELVGARLMEVEIRDLHPYLGGLRHDLRLVALSPSFAEVDVRDTPANRARRLLTWWADPADEDLTTAWLETSRTLRPAPEPVSAPDLDRLCSEWASVYFATATTRWPAYGCWEPRVSTDGSRAFVTFWVLYADWGYELHLVAILDREWKVVRVGEGVIDHF